MPPGFCLLYAPENEKELETFKKICYASVGFSVGALEPLEGHLVDGSIYSR